VRRIICGEPLGDRSREGGPHQGLVPDDEIRAHWDTSVATILCV